MRIYVVTNTLNGRQYVGRTNHELAYRLKQHGSNPRSALYPDMRSQAAGSFTIELLEEFEGHKDPGREKHWMDKLGSLAPNGYNRIAIRESALPLGRPFLNKKPRPLALSDNEYSTLLKQAKAAGFEGKPSAYLIKKLKLTPKA